MKPLIVVTRTIHPDAIAQLNRVGTVQLWDGEDAIPPNLLRDWIQTADACLTMLTDRIDDSVVRHASHLKVVSNMAVGYDNIDVGALNRHHIVVTNTPDVLTEATAELTWALLLSLLRNVSASRDDLLSGFWRTWKPDRFLGTEVAGKTLGIVGLGRIGRAVARRAAPFLVDVVALSRDGREMQDGEILRLPTPKFLQKADVVSLHVPLTNETRHLVNDQWLLAMKPGSYLINTSRGPVVDEDALMRALESGRLAGAALDVFAQDPIDRGHPLATHPRVLATPHIGSATHETRRAMALRAAENISQVLAGFPPRDLVHPLSD